VYIQAEQLFLDSDTIIGEIFQGALSNEFLLLVHLTHGSSVDQVQVVVDVGQHELFYLEWNIHLR
jgi:hypothetical protein